MKYILYRLILFFFICILFSSKYINGKRANITFFSNNLINSIKIEPDKNEVFYSNPFIGNGNILLDCEPGDKVIVNVTLRNSIIRKDNIFYMFIEFYDKTKYFFNNNNITINYTNEKKNINIFFYIPYETFCKDNTIIINKNGIINFDLQSNIFIKNHKIQSLKRLDINITETFPLNIFLYKHILTKKYTIFLNNNNYISTPIIIKYKGISITGGSHPLNECSMKIFFNKDILYNNHNRILEEDSYSYYNDSIFNNEKALKNKKIIERFFKEEINIFDINEEIFNDLCIHVEEDGKDVVLIDRIELYFQNYSICNEGCIISGIDMKKYVVTCKCSDSEVLVNDNIGKTKEINDNEFSREGIRAELADIFFEINFEVLHCFGRILSFELYLNNIGAILATSFLFVQSIAGAFLLKQIKDIRIYLYKDVINHSNPPHKKVNSMSEEENQKQCESVSSSKNMKSNRCSKKDILLNHQQLKNKRKKKNDNLGELSSRKALIVRNKPKEIECDFGEKTKNDIVYNRFFNQNKINQPIPRIYPIPQSPDDYINMKGNNFPFLNLDFKSKRQLSSKEDNKYFSKDKNIPSINKNSLVSLKKISHNEYFDDDNAFTQKTLFNKKEENKKNQIKNKEDEEKEKEKEIDIKKLKKIGPSNKNVIKIFMDKKSYVNKEVLSENYAQDTDREKKKKLEKDKLPNKIRKCKTRKTDKKRKKTMEVDTKRKEEHRNTVKMYDKKDLDEDELNQLDYDEAIIFDHRGFFELCWMELKQRQLIINTFFVKEKLKPFSIKLIVFIFSVCCYFVINGFLYESKYVSKRLRRTSKTFYFFIVDSFKRIVYSSLVIALINIVVGILFKSDKSLKRAKIKYKDNRILLNGEVVKIFKNMKIINFMFTIINFFFMVAVWIYLYCFCGVYRNCQLDWIGSTGLIYGFMQILPIIISFILALLRIIGLRCGVETCFKINAWISDNT
jgi:hypothetical protein